MTLETTPLEWQEFRVRGLLIDLDGTLVDSTSVVNEQWADIADHLSIPRSRVVGRFHGMTAHETMSRIAPDLSPSESERLVAQVHAAEISHADQGRALPGALALLQAVTPDQWCLVTSCPRELAQARLDGAGLPIPQHMVTADDVQRGKPASEPFQRGAHKLDRLPADCLAIEDAPAGVQAATAAGCQVLGVGTTHERLAATMTTDLEHVVMLAHEDSLIIRVAATDLL